MRKYAADNLMFLRKEYPSVYKIIAGKEIDDNRVIAENTKNGLPNLNLIIKDRHIAMYSKYNPYLEAERWFAQIEPEISNKEQILLFGLGLGYQLEILLRNYPNKRYYLLEPDIEIFKAFVASRDMQEVLMSKNISALAIGSSSYVYTKIMDMINLNVVDSFSCVASPFYQRYYEEELKNLTATAKQLRLSFKGNLATRFFFSEQWPENIIRNFPYIMNTPDISSLKDVFKDLPAIIVGSGPSLNDDLDMIKSLQGKCLIISAGTSIQALTANGITPDLVVSIDGGDANNKAFEDLDLSNIPLLYSSMVHYKIVEKQNLCPIFVRIGVDSIIEYLHPKAEDIPVFHSSSSVTGTAIQAAKYFGCNPVIFTGQDMSYPNDAFYTEGVKHVEQDILNKIINEAHEKIENVNGGFNRTTSKMLNTLNDMENLILVKYPDATFINASRRGAVIRGTVFIPLEEWVNANKELCEQEKASLMAIVQDLHANIDSRKSREVSRKILNDFKKQLAVVDREMTKIWPLLDAIDIQKDPSKLQIKVDELTKLWSFVSSLQIFEKVYMMMIKHQLMIYTRDLAAVGSESDREKRARLLVKSLTKIAYPLSKATPMLREWAEQAEAKINESLPG